MKRNPLIRAIAVPLIAFTLIFFAGFIGQGCNTTQQQIAAQSIAALEVGAKSAYDGYLTLVVNGTIPTNSVPQATRAYNDFQASALLAALAVQNNTNALAPTNLTTEFQALTTLLNTIQGH